MVDKRAGTPPSLDREPDFTSQDPYRVLGLTQTATQVEIKRAYFALIRQHPPETEGDTFKQIRAAYEKIKSAKRRAETDVFLPQPPPPWDPDDLPEPKFDARLYPKDILILVRSWGDLGRTDFQADFKEIPL